MSNDVPWFVGESYSVAVARAQALANQLQSVVRLVDMESKRWLCFIVPAGG